MSHLFLRVPLLPQVALHLGECFFGDELIVSPMKDQTGKPRGIRKTVA